MKARILITDDDWAVRDSLRKVLTNAGYEVCCAQNADEAEKALGAESVDLLILDLGLPEESGWNVFGLANAARPLLPIIILSGLKEQIENSLLPGVAAFLEKPVDVPLLLEKIDRILSEPPETRLRRIMEQLQTDRGLRMARVA